MSSIDTTQIGIAAARLMELLATEYPNGVVKEALVVVEVHTSDESDEHAYISTPFYCTNWSRVYQRGLLDYALDVARTGEAADGNAFYDKDTDEDDDED